MAPAQGSPDDTVGDLVSQVTDALGAQVELQVALVRAELRSGASALGRDLGPLVVATPLLGVGYAFGCVAAALALSRWLGPAGGCGIISALNLLLGGLAAYTGLRRARRRAQKEVVHVS